MDDPIVWTRTWARVQDVFNKFLGNGPLFPIRLESVVGTAAFGTEFDLQSFTLGGGIKISRVVGRKGH